MSRPNTARGESKFTRGEKCIFVHLIVTFVLIIFFIIVYFIHLCVVDHNLLTAVKVTRRKLIENPNDNDTLGFMPVGLLYLDEVPARVLCNSLLLTQNWSLAPGHCVAMRSDPEMASLLRSWRIQYLTQSSEYIASEIKRSIPHPHFSRDDFNNNIGIIEHYNPIDTYKYVFPDATIDDETLQQYAYNMLMVGWEPASLRRPDGNKNIIKYSIRPVDQEKCIRFVAPIVELRNYEYCVIPRQRSNDLPDHGAVFMMDSQILGFFSWGERSGKGMPYIIVNILHFKEWIEDIISL